MVGAANIGMRAGVYHFGLGITASHVRAISDGRNYDRFFPGTQGTDPIVNPNAEVHDTLHFIAEVVKKTLADTKNVVQQLKKRTMVGTLKSIFDFHYDHYQYRLDKAGVEQVRRPARAWKDRKQGIDCDCFTTSVSSMLTNLGIPHYLKIIAIKNRSYFQHIYVIIPKFKGADISRRTNYWVIDPVLNRFDEEAPSITKKDHLFMNGIPLQFLNGAESGTVGLGKEFDDIEAVVNGLGDLDSDAWFDGFKKRLRRHVGNTRRKVMAQPGAVEAVYQPAVLAGLLAEAEHAFSLPDDQLIAALEGLAAREHTCLQPRFQGSCNAVHGHDDHLYGEMFGELDETMLGTVLGLGKKGKAAKKKAAVKAAPKKGPLTKIKNAVKKVAEVKKIVKAKPKAEKKKGALKAKVGKVLKKVAKVVVKTNPAAIAARAGFLVAMRTNFAKIAEKAYWGYQDAAAAKKAGIAPDYHAKCKTLLDRIRKTFIGTLKGEESALKKAIINGRAAKKVSKTMKGLGYLGSTADLFGLGDGGASAAGTTIAAALAFLTPIVKWVNDTFKAKKPAGKTTGKRKAKGGKTADAPTENENGTNDEGASEDGPTEVNEMIDQAQNPDDSIVMDDSSVEAAVMANEEEPSNSQDEDSEKKKVTGKPAPLPAPVDRFKTPAATPGASATDVSADSAEESGPSESPFPQGQAKTAGGGSKVLILGLGVAALAALALNKGKKEPKAAGMNGVDGFSSKRESAKLKSQAKKKGLKLPYGYKVEKREVKSLKLK